MKDLFEVCVQFSPSKTESYYTAADSFDQARLQVVTWLSNLGYVFDCVQSITAKASCSAHHGLPIFVNPTTQE